MPIQIPHASLSVGASVDQQTGHLSIFELLEEIRVPQVPLHVPQMALSLSIKKNNPNNFVGKIVIHLINPKQEQALLGSGDLEIAKNQNRIKAVFRFGGFPFQNFGIHRFVISTIDEKGQKISENLIDLDIIKQAHEEKSNPPGNVKLPH